MRFFVFSLLHFYRVTHGPDHGFGPFRLRDACNVLDCVDGDKASAIVAIRSASFACGKNTGKRFAQCSRLVQANSRVGPLVELHSRAIAIGPQRVDRLLDSTEVVIWITDSALRKTVEQAQIQWTTWAEGYITKTRTKNH